MTISSSEPPAENSTRELAAIMFSDIAGYTLVMGRDEHQAMQALARHREVLRDLVPKFHGRMLGEIGDGTLSAFHSALDAVSCARELQSKLVDDPRLKLRIGIDVGDVLFANNTVLGDGVNSASRIHALAPPGGICISEHVYHEIQNKPEIHAKYLGRKRLKNVSRPIPVYAVMTTAAVEGVSSAFLQVSWRRYIRMAAVGALATGAAIYSFAYSRFLVTSDPRICWVTAAYALWRCFRSPTFLATRRNNTLPTE